MHEIVTKLSLYYIDILRNYYEIDITNTGKKYLPLICTRTSKRPIQNSYGSSILSYSTCCTPLSQLGTLLNLLNRLILKKVHKFSTRLMQLYSKCKSSLKLP